MSLRDPPGMRHRLLRAATRVDHATLDGMMLRIDLTARQDYGMFLQAHHSVLQTLAAHWREADREDFAGMLHAVEQDILTLQMGIEPARRSDDATLPSMNQWGIAYVVRGSRLGAQFLRRGVPAELPTAYLDFTPVLTWPRFLEQLELSPENQSRTSSDDAIRGARAAFEIFTSAFARGLAGQP